MTIFSCLFFVFVFFDDHFRKNINSGFSSSVAKILQCIKTVEFKEACLQGQGCLLAGLGTLCACQKTAPPWPLNNPFTKIT